MSKKTKKRPRATLQHHRHTGKVLAHRHTHYPALFLLLLVVGVFLACFQYSVVRADDLEVTAKISAPTPTVPAAIQEPRDNQTVHEPTFTVRGTCEVLNPAVVIIIYRGTTVLGSTTCQTNGTFALTVTLQPGTNQLIAKTFNITNDAGPDSTTITVTYTVAEEPSEAAVPRQEPTGTPGDESPGKVLSIRSEVAFMVFGPDKAAQWRGAIEGGTPPYNMSVTWDDGQTETQTDLGQENLVLSHVYAKLRTYFVTVTATDAAGQSVDYHLVAVTPTQPVSAMAMPIHPEGGSTTMTFAKVYIAYVGALAIGALAFYEAHVLQAGLLAKHRFATQKVKFPKIGRFR